VWRPPVGLAGTSLGMRAPFLIALQIANTRVKSPNTRVKSRNVYLLIHRKHSPLDNYIR
jgi:hypothetical protein